MDQRFFIPALILILASYAYTRDKRLLWLYAGLSVTALFNQGLVLEAMSKYSLPLIPNEDLFMKLLGLANLVLFVYLLKTTAAVYFQKKIIPLGTRVAAARLATQAELTGSFPLQSLPKDKLLDSQDEQRGGKLKWSRLDWILMGVLTLVYSIIALYNLGTIKSPQTYWKPSNRGESFYIDFGGRYSIGRISYFFGLGQGSYTLEFSNDAQKWEQPQLLSQKTQFEMIEWRYILMYSDYQYVRVTCESPGVMLKEVGFFKKDSEELIPVKNVVYLNVATLPDNGKPANVFDEPDTVAFLPSYLNGMHFDEVYHARTGYEHSLLYYPSETTHPPLGKLIIALGILIFGMSPFGWRIMGTLIGISMLPIFYAFGKRVFQKTEYAFMSAFLMAFDFMHFTQTRIATIDVYGVFFIILMYYFMYKYFHMNFFRDKLNSTLTPLFLSGLFAGMGIASKWTALWGAAGLAVLFFWSLYSRYMEYRFARWQVKGKKGMWLTFYFFRKRLYNRIKAFFIGTAKGFLQLPFMQALLKNTNAQRLASLEARQNTLIKTNPEDDVPRGERKENEYKLKVFFPNMFKTLGWCTLVFILLPVLIMELSYIPIMLARNSHMTPLGVFQDQVYMFNYHSAITQTHPFMSQWWEWPLHIKPIWYFSGQANLPPEKISSIVAFGNPAIWWLGILTVPLALCIALFKKHKWMVIIIIIAASQYLPWIVIPRKVVFIYHFFPTVPFLMLATVYCLKFMAERVSWFKYVNYAYLGLVLLLFVMFYPIISGLVVDKSYVADWLRWFPTWFFYS
jgi:hypothetical protein